MTLAVLLNGTAWMGLASFSLLWLAAGEATIICYTMPVWASIFAWFVLGERITARRLMALGVGLIGVGADFLLQALGVDLPTVRWSAYPATISTPVSSFLVVSSIVLGGVILTALPQLVRSLGRVQGKVPSGHMVTI